MRINDALGSKKTPNFTIIILEFIATHNRRRIAGILYEELF